MKAITTNQSSLFFNSAVSAGLLTSAWGDSFPVQARCAEAAAQRAASRRLRRFESESSDWQEMGIRAVLAVAVLSAYATVIWQIASF